MAHYYAFQQVAKSAEGEILGSFHIDARMLTPIYDPASVEQAMAVERPTYEAIIKEEAPGAAPVWGNIELVKIDA